MTKLKPWALGPFELLQHADEHLQLGLDIDKRMALIGFDNAIEVSIITYLLLHPSQRAGRQFPRADVERWERNFHTKLEFLEHFISRYSEAGMTVGLDEMMYIHQIRNELYHNGKGLVPAEAQLKDARRAAVWVFDVLFDEDAESLLQTRQDPAPGVPVDEVQMSPQAQFLQAFIRLRKSLEGILAGLKGGDNVALADLHTAWAEVIQQFDEAGAEEHLEALKLADEVHHSLLEGKNEEVISVDIQKVADLLELASDHLDDRLKEHHVKLVDAAVAAAVKGACSGGNGKLGILYQAPGSGLSLTLAAFVAKATRLPEYHKSPIVIFSDRLALTEQARRTLADNLQPAGIRVEANLEGLNTPECAPAVLVTTVQTLLARGHTYSGNALLVGYNLQSEHPGLMAMFPNATWILFTSTPLAKNRSPLIFGPVVAEYNWDRAVADGCLLPIEVISVRGTQSLTSPDGLVRDEKLRGTIQDIVIRFKQHRKSGGGKAIVLVSSTTMQREVYASIAILEPGWIGGRSEDLVTASISPGRTGSDLIRRLSDPDDSLSLAIVSESALAGGDIPVVDVAFMLGAPERYNIERLKSQLGRGFEGKRKGFIISYTNFADT